MRPLLKHSRITDLILRGFYDVYNELGHGFLESVYENALTIVLREFGLRVDQQKGIAVRFRGVEVGHFVPDMIVDDCVIVEAKAVESLLPAHEAQLMHYLKTTSIEVGLLLNFGKAPEFRRFAYDNQRKCIQRSSA
jgi:GxxExxY protein